MSERTAPTGHDTARRTSGGETAKRSLTERLQDTDQYLEWYGRNIWLLVPIQNVIKDFFADFNDYPYQTGSSLNAGNINYGLLRQQDALKRLGELESLKPK